MDILEKVTELKVAGASVVQTVRGPKVAEGKAPALLFEVWLRTQTGPSLAYGGGAGRLMLARASGESGWFPSESLTLWGSVAPGERDSRELAARSGEALSVIVMRLAFPLTPHLLETIDRLVEPTWGVHVELATEVQLHALQGTIPAAASAASTVTHRLRPDDWRQLARALGLGTRRIFELRAESFENLIAFEGACRALDKAKLLFEAGDHPDKVIGECRIVVEAVLEKLGHAGKGTFWYDRMKAAGLPDAWISFLRAFKDVVNPAHHPTDYRWSRAEAEFALHAAAGLAAYLALLPSHP